MEHNLFFTSITSFYLYLQPTGGSFVPAMSKIVQAEYKAKARFLALLRRRRFSRQRKQLFCLSTLQR